MLVKNYQLSLLLVLVMLMHLYMFRARRRTKVVVEHQEGTVSDMLLDTNSSTYSDMWETPNSSTYSDVQEQTNGSVYYARYSGMLHRELSDHELRERDHHFSMWEDRRRSLYVRGKEQEEELLQDAQKGDIVLFQCAQDRDTAFIKERLHTEKEPPDALSLQRYIPDLSAYALSEKAHRAALAHRREWTLPVHEYLTQVARHHNLSVLCIHKAYLDPPPLRVRFHSGWISDELSGFRCLPIPAAGEDADVELMEVNARWSGQKAKKVFVGLESLQNQPWNQASVKDGDVVLSHAKPHNLSTWSSLSYLTGELGLYMQDTAPFAERTAPLMYWISNCVQFRKDLIASITKHVPTTAMGACVAPGSDPPTALPGCQRQGRAGIVIGMNDEKLCVYRRSRLALALENSYEDMYMTEKLWLPLLAGAVPVYAGAPQVKDWLPSPEAAIDLRSFPSTEEAVRYVQQVQSNETLWNYHTAWRKRPFSIPFLHLARNSLQSLYCNLPPLLPPVTKEACFSWATFADAKYAKTLQRITAEAKAFGIFDELYPYDESMLGEAFMRRNREFMQTNPRGYGYWVWKPFVVQEVLKRMKPGCFLVFTDVGCTIQKAGMKRFLEYVRLLNENNKHMLGFQMHHTEGAWTKGDLFHFMNATAAGLESTGQIISGIHVTRNSPEGRALASRWRTIMQDHPQLITDAPSVQPNFPGFIEHRHDQSVLSMLLKTEFAPIAHLVPDETYHQDFSQIAWVPFTATRIKY